MRLMGAVLVFCGALWGYMKYRAQVMLPLRVGRALVGDLAVLRSGVCGSRRPLPAILARELSEGPGARYVWIPFQIALACSAEGEGVTVRDCWTHTVDGLPPPLSAWLLPLGPLLGTGGEALGQAIDEVREELLCYVRIGEEKRSEQLKLSAALCFSGACFVVLILL